MDICIHDIDVPLLFKRLRQSSKEGNIEVVRKLLQSRVYVDDTDSVSLILSPSHVCFLRDYLSNELC